MANEVNHVMTSFDGKDRNICKKCGTSEHAEVINYSMMSMDGDVVCSKCGTYIRMYDAG